MSIPLRHSNPGFRLVLPLFLIPLGIGTSGAQPLPFGISWEPVVERVSLGEPILVRLTVQNYAAETVEVNLGGNYTQGLLVTVVPPNGKPDRRPPPELHGLQPAGRHRIKGGQRYIHDVQMDEWYTFADQGVYEIRIGLRSPVKIGDRAFAPPPEIPIHIIIGPRDDQALARRCEFLAGRVVNASEHDEAWDAAMALNHVRNPIVVDSLVRALDTQFPVPRSIILNALGKFFTSRSVDVLIGLALGGDPGEAGLARQYLLQSARESADAGLRKRVYEALGPPDTR